jgi:hypothetical protein
MKVKILKKLRREVDRKATFKRGTEKVNGKLIVVYTVRWEKNRARKFICDGDPNSRCNAMEFYEKKRREIFEHLFWYHYKREAVFPRI